MRCAIYTRVSTEHGLDQQFNSLDNQRDAAEAYIRSQAHEGWLCLPAQYDDGGFSGASLERPALQRLLADIRERSIDVVVVYKVDRLTRSLADFAKLVELFDEHGASFVSVTQAFNTTTSMGRLTLNVLLSFAQFEREVTGERIRDKIAAAKKKGLWMGGVVPLGYRVEARKLIADESEAVTVRLIFQRYFDLGSLPRLQQELRQLGITSRVRRLATGRIVGGVAFTNGPLAHLLRNRVYLREINHHGSSHAGEHAPIIAHDLFEQVQAKLTENLNGHRARRTASQALLTGRLVDDRGHRMTPSVAIKHGVRYRYYVSCVLAQGRRAEAGSIARVSASEIERLVMDALRSRAGAQEHAGTQELDEASLAARDLERVTVHPKLLEIRFKASGIDTDADIPADSTVRLPWSPAHGPRRREIVGRAGADGVLRPLRAESRAKLLRAIAQARCWLERLITGEVTGTDSIAAAEHVSERHVRTILTLAFLSPALVKAAIDGTLPRGMGLTRLFDLPSSWAEQHAILGLPPPQR